MKKSIITTIITLVLISHLGYSQPNFRQASLDSTSNFYTIKADFETWYDTVQLPDSVKMRALKHFGRWASFWESRVQSNIAAYDGTFEGYAKALGSYWLDPSCTTPDEANWHNIGPFPADLHDMGFIQSIWVNPDNNNEIMVGSGRTSGILKSTDAGQTWYDVLSPSRIPALGITFISSNSEWDHNLKTNIYASTGSPMTGFSVGILKSDDMGETWEIMDNFPPYANQEYNYVVNKVLKAPGTLFDPDVIYAITNDKFYHSTDGGTSWSSYAFGFDGELTDMEVDPNNKNRIAISGDPFNTTTDRARLWLSTDGGVSFSEILGSSGYSNLNNIQRIQIDFPTSDRLYMLTREPNQTGRVFYYDFSQTPFVWDITNTNNYFAVNFAGLGQFNGAFVVSYDYQTYYIGTECLAIANPGSNASCLSGYHYYTTDSTHCDIRCIHVIHNYIWLGTDGGLTFSPDNGITWKSLNGKGASGIVNNEIVGFDISNEYEPSIIVGLIDNSFKFYKEKWHSSTPLPLLDPVGNVIQISDVGIADAGKCYIYPHDADQFHIISHSYGFCRGKYNATGNFDLTIDMSNNPQIYWGYEWHMIPIAANNNSPSMVYVGGLGWTNSSLAAISKSDDLINWDEIFLPSTGRINNIVISPANPDIIYATTIHKTHDGNSCVGGVLRSDDGGDNWIDITGGNPANAVRNQNYSITGITVDWNDPNKVWVCMGGVPFENNSPFPPLLENRVFRTDDASANPVIWVDMTNGPNGNLPPLPTTAIVNQPGTSRVFLATDGGIFYRDDDDPDWICFSNGFPITHITDMKINRTTNEIYASTYGYSIFKAPLPCFNYTPQTTIIDDDITWSDKTLVMGGDIQISSGQTLTIDKGSVIYMPPNKAIIVNQGATLIVDNSTITSCDSMWRGIIVNGSGFAHQFGNTQGTVKIISGSTIANALTGIATGKKRNATGGIIQAENSGFYNCEYAIRMHPYRNYHPNDQSKTLPNRSYFENCTFRTTTELLNPGLKPKSFIWVNGIHHLKITGNTFSNINPDEPNRLLRGNGIFSYNSLINVHPLCTDYLLSPCTQWKPNTFTGLHSGILAMASQPNIPLSVKMANFEDNWKGIYLNGISNASIIQSNFKVFTESNMPYKTYGLYLDNCTGYTIEENIFSSDTGMSQSTTLGMVINNSGEETNEVYNNIFSDLTYGLIAQHDNRGIDKHTGLKIKCNDFSDVVLTDIGVTKESWYNGITGISNHQGSDVDVTSPAGNTFSWQNLYYYSDINNNGLFISKYYHHDIQGSTPVQGENWVPLYYNSQKVLLEKTVGLDYTNKTTACPLNSGGNPVPIEQLYSKAEAEQVNVNSSKLVLNIWRDGGMPDLPEQVELAYPWETYDYYNLLMLESPYLSDQTLIAAINNTDLLPDLLLKLILIANPQCTRSDEVLLAIEEREPQLPEYMIDEIMLGEDLPSPLEALEATVSYHVHERQNTLNRIITIYLNDTVNSYARDSLVALFDRDEYLNAKYAKAFIHLYENDFEALDIMMSDIGAMLDGEDYQQQQYQEYLGFMEIARIMHEDSLSYEDLTTSQIDLLYNLAENGMFFPAAYARSLLKCYDPEFEYEEPIALPVVETYRKRGPVQFVPDTIGCSFKVYPNPALDYVILDFGMQKEDITAVVHITDNKGRLINTIHLDEPVGQLMVGCRELTSGLYHFTLITKRKIVISRKVTIAR